MHCKAHQCGHTETIIVNCKADNEAKRAACVEIMRILLLVKGIKLEVPKYSKNEDKLAEKLKCQKKTLKDGGSPVTYSI